MPAHTIHSAMVELYFSDDGAPWTFPTWQTLTGVKHGLFPNDDSQLPNGWTRRDADFIRSYLDQYSKLRSQDEKIRFAAARKNASAVPGRDLWRDFITTCWKNKQIHAKITTVLSEEGLHPVQLALASKAGTLENFPSSVDYVAEAVDPVGKALFGFDCLDKGGRMDMNLRAATRWLIYRTWLNIKNQVLRSKSRIVQLEQDAMLAFDSTFLQSI